MLGIKRKDQDHFPEIIETFIILAIVLVIVHTLLDELSIIYSWSHEAHINIVVTGFIFDLIFTVEFFGRMMVARRLHSVGQYITAERGWVDGLTSVPLLLLVSGPAMVLYFSGHEAAGAGLQFLHILKSAKAIRVTRVLRLIRVVKLFGKIQNTDSTMTNRQVGSIATITVVALITVLVTSQFISLFNFGDHEDYMNMKVAQLHPLFDAQSESGFTEKSALNYLKRSPISEDVIEIRDPAGKLIFENPRKEVIQWSGFQDRAVAIGGGYTVWFSYHVADSHQSRLNIFVLVAILVIITFLVVFYTRIFAQQVADPIYIMDKGLRLWDYNLEVKIDPHFKHEEVYRLARAFNSRWLPLKNQIRRIKKEKQLDRSDIRMEDLF